MKILDGKVVRDAISAELLAKIRAFSEKPKLVIFQVGDRSDSNSYVRQKILFGEKIGVVVELKKYPENISEDFLLSEIGKANKDKSVHGIIVQLPLPAHILRHNIIEAVVPEKDVDGLTSKNMELLLEGRPNFVPATAKGIISLLEYYRIPIAGKKAVVVGRSLLVGKPAALILLAKNATVQICHRQTSNLEEETKKADILVVACGKAGLIGKEHISPGQIVVDVGINEIKTADGGRKISGDVNFEEVKNVVGAISPVPGGVGPMTVASLFENLFQAFLNHRRKF